MNDDRLFKVEWVEGNRKAKPEYVVAKSHAEMMAWVSRRIGDSEMPEKFDNVTVVVTPLGLGPKRAEENEDG